MKKIYYCEQFPREISQHRLAYFLLERALTLAYPEISWKNVKYGREELGKPFLEEHPGILFNISHCKTCVACVIGDSAVGIDVERRFSWKEPLARRITHSGEWDWLGQTEDVRAARLNLLWSRKESYLKCVGTGIRSDLRKINVLGELIDEGGSFYFQELQTPEFTLAVCSREKEEASIVRMDWQDLCK